MKKVLFITHETTRTGAPLILLYLLRWLNKNTSDYQFDMLMLNEGGVKEDFIVECNNVYLYSELNKTPKFSIVFKKKLLAKLGLKSKNNEYLLLEKIARNKYDLIYANTILSIPVAIKIKGIFNESKLLVHVHELNMLCKMLLPSFSDYVRFIDKYIAVSERVKDNLIVNYGINSDLIKTIYGFGVPQMDMNQHKFDKVFTVGASGNAHWIKGYDIFILVANQFVKRYPDIKIEFVWVGNYSENKIVIEEDILKLNLNEKMNFVGEVKEPQYKFKNFDIFLLTSREDSFPMVCIENANLKKPIICFENATGVAEIIKRGGGYVVPYLDIDAMIEKIKYYYDNPSKVKEEGEIAQRLFSGFSCDKICPLLYEQIVSILK